MLLDNAPSLRNARNTRASLTTDARILVSAVVWLAAVAWLACKPASPSALDASLAALGACKRGAFRIISSMPSPPGLP